MTEQESTTTVRSDNAFSEELQSMCNLEGITLIWYDPNLNVTTRQQLRISKQHLRPINDFVIFHKNEQECIKTIKAIKNEKILLVTCGSGANSILSFNNGLVHKCVQAVFIFCQDKENYEFLGEIYPKIIGIFTETEELKSSIEKEVTAIQTLFETYNFYNEKEEKSMVDLSTQSAKFLWQSKFKYLVVRMPKNEQAKREMVETCTKYYHNNKEELKRIETFNKEYKPELAIHWYTRPSFVYKLVNKALRIEDIDQLYVFRYYIRDLSEAINKPHKQITEERSWTFYRGVRLPLNEVEKFKQSEGKLISTNGFLSMSLSKKVASNFALRRTLKDTEEPVIFEIECNNESAKFAFIEKHSALPEEKEVLFDFCVTFKVLSITKSREEYSKEDIWIVKMRSTQEGNELAQLYIERCKKELEKGKPVELLWPAILSGSGHVDKSIKYAHKQPGILNVAINKMWRPLHGGVTKHEEYDEALKYVERQKKKKGKKKIRPRDYLVSGMLYEMKGEYDQALAEYWTSIRLDEVVMDEGGIGIPSCYCSIGTIHCLKGQYQLALDYFSKSNEIGKKHYEHNHMFYAAPLQGFGDVCREKGELHRAMDFYQRAADVYEKYTPRNNAEIFSKMGYIQDSLGDYDKSLKHYQDAIEISQQNGVDALQIKAFNFKVYGKIHKLKGELQKALECFEEALKIELQIHGPNHPLVASYYYTKGTMLECLDRNDEALMAYKAALPIQKAVFPEGHRHMARTLSRIGNQYRRKGELALAETYCKDALVMQEKLLPPNHIDISFTLSYIGTILYDQEDYNESRTYLWRALKIQKNFSSEASHRYQILTLITIGYVNIKLNALELALICLKKALAIKEEVFPLQHSQISELRRKIEEVEQL